MRNKCHLHAQVLETGQHVDNKACHNKAKDIGNL